jgi:hypothetical protein
MKSIARGFQEMPKHLGNVCYPILQDEHIQWLVERLHVDPDIPIEFLYCHVNEVFNFHTLYLLVFF